MILEMTKGNTGIMFGVKDPDHTLYYSKKFDEYVMARAIWDKVNLETEYTTKFEFDKISNLTFSDFIVYAELEEVSYKTFDINVLLNLFDLFEGKLRGLSKISYLIINDKIAKSPKFDNVAFLSSALTEFYFLYKTTTVIKLEYNSSAMLDIYPSNRVSELVTPQEVERKDRMFWTQAFSYLGGLVKDHSNDELKILLSSDCNYITKDEVKNILKLN